MNTPETGYKNGKHVELGMLGTGEHEELGIWGTGKIENREHGEPSTH